MSKHKRPRRTSDFNIPGRLRYSEKNPRGKDAEWIEFAVIKSEMDTIMQAIGTKAMATKDKELSAGTMISEICSEWMNLTKKEDDQEE